MKLTHVFILVVMFVRNSGVVGTVTVVKEAYPGAWCCAKIARNLPFILAPINVLWSLTLFGII